MDNRLYDVLKWIALIFLPALGTLWFAISRIWGLSYSEEILGTITALDAFLGALLGVSTTSYRKGITQTIETLKTAKEGDSDKEEE